MLILCSSSVCDVLTRYVSVEQARNPPEEEISGINIAYSGSHSTELCLQYIA